MNAQVLNDLAKMQQHRDAWRGYAYGIKDKPTDFIDGNMVDRPMTFLEINAERLAKAENKLAELKHEWDGEKYVFTHQAWTPETARQQRGGTYGT